MGRPKGSTNAYKPFRPKKEGVEYGSYRVWDRVKKQVVSLDTQDFTEAVSKAARLIGGVPATGVSESPRPEQHFPEDRRVPISEGPASGIPASRILADWASLGNPTPIEPSGTPPETSQQTHQPDTGLRVIPGGAEPKASKKQKGLTPEQAEKLGRGLTKIVTKLNAVGAEMCVRMLGRDPYPLDEEDFELIELGWELFIAEHFGKTQPKPWMLILAGNCMIVFAMYVRGTPIPKEKKDDGILPPA